MAPVMAFTTVLQAVTDVTLAPSRPHDPARNCADHPANLATGGGFS